jgi:hypothetical protein
MITQKTIVLNFIVFMLFLSDFIFTGYTKTMVKFILLLIKKFILGG